jgi:hypothetical protein
VSTKTAKEEMENLPDVELRHNCNTIRYDTTKVGLRIENCEPNRDSKQEAGGGGSGRERALSRGQVLIYRIFELRAATSLG